MNTLSNFRKEINKTQKEMAEILGISISLYEKIESGNRNPSYSFLVKFKKVFPKENLDKIFLESIITKCD